MSQENIALLHGNLNANALALVSNARAVAINQRVQNLQITDDLMNQSLQQVDVEDDTFTVAAAVNLAELNRDSRRLIGNKIATTELLRGFGHASASYKMIPSKKGLFGGISHAKNDVITCKKLFQFHSENLKAEVLALLNYCKANPVFNNLVIGD